MTSPNSRISVDLKSPGWERIVEPEPGWEVIAEDVLFGEGPVWDRSQEALYFTDICGDTIWKWSRGRREVVLRPTTKANGMFLDPNFELLVAGWGSRMVFRLRRDGSIERLATHWKGQKLTSPNDIVMRSDGSIYFTDPPGGCLNVGMVGDDLQRYLDFAGVFRIAPDGTLSLETTDLVYPNGLCFSPDEKLLYVNCTNRRQIHVFDVAANGALSNRRLLFQHELPERPSPDGMKCDREGNVYCTGPGGIWVHRPDGSVICRLRIEGHVSNFGFGEADWRSLFVTMIGCVARTRLLAAGLPSR